MIQTGGSLCLSVWPALCMSMHHVCAVLEPRCVSPLGLELKMVVRHQVGAGNRTWASVRATSALNCQVISSAPTGRLLRVALCTKHVVTTVYILVVFLTHSPSSWHLPPTCEVGAEIPSWATTV